VTDFGGTGLGFGAGTGFETGTELDSKKEKSADAHGSILAAVMAVCAAGPKALVVESSLDVGNVFPLNLFGITVVMEFVGCGI
jgi:hypothetical protein